MEVTISYVHIGPLFLPVLLILMVLKFVAVVSYFMHLKFDNKIFSFMFYIGLGLAVFVYCAALSTFHFFSSGAASMSIDVRCSAILVHHRRLHGALQRAQPLRPEVIEETLTDGEAFHADGE